MPQVDVFFDSSALIAGIISEMGAARALLLLSEDGWILLTISEQVVAEVERNLARKAPTALPFARQILRVANIRIWRNPSREEVEKHLGWTSHAADIPILLAAKQAGVDFFATLDAHHLLNDPRVAEKTGLRIGTPGDALAWVRDKFSGSPAVP